MPSHATSVFEEGLMVPPIKLWDQGVRNEAALRIMTRNSRMPDSLAADLDAECSACLMGSRRLSELFERYGRETVEACFDALIDKTTETYRREILSKIPDGTYVWEDYAEHDGVDEPRLHTQRITLTMDSSREAPLVLDFTGTSPQAKGPINHCGDYAGGNFLKKWLAPILRNLADTPERMAELDVNEGIVPLIEMRFPPPGTLLTPVFPAPTNARTFVILRLLGVLAGVVAKAVDGRMPADQETIRYTGVYGTDRDGEPYLMREVLGGGSGGRYYADGEDTIHVVPDSRNLPTEFTESRFPFLVERLGLAVDSGGAGQFRGGLGYEKHIRMLRDAHFMSIADRSILACWGVKGGKAGQPFQVTVDLGGPDQREVDALADAEPVRAGRGDPDPHDGRRRLGRPPRPRGRRRRARRALGQGERRGRAPRLRRRRWRYDGAEPVLDTAATDAAARRPAVPSHRRGALLRPRARLRAARGRTDARRRRRPLTSAGKGGGVTPDEVLAYCLAKPGAWQDEPWEGDVVAKVGPKIFAFLGDGASVGVKCGRSRDEADEWLARHPEDAHVMAYIGRSGWNTLRVARRVDPRRRAARGRRRVLRRGRQQAAEEGPPAGVVSRRVTRPRVPGRPGSRATPSASTVRVAGDDTGVGHRVDQAVVEQHAGGPGLLAEAERAGDADLSRLVDRDAERLRALPGHRRRPVAGERERRETAARVVGERARVVQRRRSSRARGGRGRPGSAGTGRRCRRRTPGRR